MQWLLGVETLRGWIQSIVKPDFSVIKKVNVLPPQYSTRKTEKAVILQIYRLTVLLFVSHPTTSRSYKT